MNATPADALFLFQTSAFGDRKISLAKEEDPSRFSGGSRFKPNIRMDLAWQNPNAEGQSDHGDRHRLHVDIGILRGHSDLQFGLAFEK
jgi:hypothetical protein